MRLTIILFVALTIASAGSSKEASPNLKEVWSSDKVASSVGKILVRDMERYFPRSEGKVRFKHVFDGKDLPEESKTQYEEPPFYKSLHEVFADRTIYGDCALVKLTWYLHLDGELSEDFHAELKKRGRRLIPLFELLKQEGLYEEASKVIRPSKSRIEEILKELKKMKK